MSDQSSETGGAVATPPPAPPLPPPSSASLAANAIARFAQRNIGYGARVSTSPYEDIDSSPTPGLSLPKIPRSDHEISSSHTGLREIAPFARTWKSQLVPPGVDRATANIDRSPVATRYASHKTGIEITSLDISPCRTRAVLAGRDILKTVTVDASTCIEDSNLRDNIVRYATTHQPAAGKISAKHKDLLAAFDVKWSHGEFDSTIATAASNGQIVVYDLNRAGVELARLHEHTRQVHRLGFNPFRGNLLLSGSQDGTTRLWDLRALTGERSVMTCQSKRYPGNSEGIRDLRWSPTNGEEFAVGTDRGVVQRWDIRKESSPSLSVKAHDQTVNAVDWHPHGKYLASGSADQTISIWDFSSSDRKMKHSWQIEAPQNVTRLRWRPASWSTAGHAPGSWQCTQLAASYGVEDPQIHVWDLRRPFVPARIVKRYDGPPTDMLWHSEDLLWSVDSTGTFNQTDVKLAPNPMDGSCITPMDVSPQGTMFLASSGKGQRRRKSLEDVTNNLLRIQRGEVSGSGGNSTAHSSSPGSHEEPSLLGSAFRNRRSKFPSSSKPTRTMDSTTPPGSEDVLPLEQSLHPRNLFHNQQALHFGQLPGGVGDVNPFKFRARHYKAPPESHASNRSFNLHLDLEKAMLRNARVADYTGDYRLGQTWRILAFGVKTELAARAESSYQKRQQASIDQASEEAKAVQDSTTPGLNDFSLATTTLDDPSSLIDPTQTDITLPEPAEKVEFLGGDARTESPASSPVSVSQIEKPQDHPTEVEMPFQPLNLDEEIKFDDYDDSAVMNSPTSSISSARSMEKGKGKTLPALELPMIANELAEQEGAVFDPHISLPFKIVEPPTSRGT